MRGGKGCFNPALNLWHTNAMVGYLLENLCTALKYVTEGL